MRHVNLDHQAATPLLPEVFEAMKPYFFEAYGNPSSLHQHGLRVRDALAQARAQVATFLNAASPEEIHTRLHEEVYVTRVEVSVG